MHYHNTECGTCNFREATRRKLTLPNEAYKRIKALRKAVTVAHLNYSVRGALVTDLHAWLLDMRLEDYENEEMRLSNHPIHTEEYKKFVGMRSVIEDMLRCFNEYEAMLRF